MLGTTSRGAANRFDSTVRRILSVVGLGLAMAAASAMAADCGSGSYPFPYTDVTVVGDAFCPGIMEAYVTGVTKGTTATTFGPDANVTRLQMSTFLQRSLDQGLVRSSRRAALNQWWTPGALSSMQSVAIGGTPFGCTSDGDNIWVANLQGVVQVQASTGKIVGTWSAIGAVDAVSAAGKVFVTTITDPGMLYVIDPTQPPGEATLVASNLGNTSRGITFDGTHLWTAQTGSVSIITPQDSPPYPVTTVTTGFATPAGILFDGTNVWVTDDASLLRLDSAGAILQTVVVGNGAEFPVFDGQNIWVPSFAAGTVTVVQASTGNVVATIVSDETSLLDNPVGASFDGSRVLVTNYPGSVSVFNAANLKAITNVPIAAGTTPRIPCSDGLNFWIPLMGTGNLLRF